MWHNKIINQPAEIFDYIIRISNVVNLTDKWGYENEYGTNVNDFITHSKVYHDYGLKKIASLQSSYIDTFLTQENLNDASTFGFIPIKTLYRINKKREKLDTFRLDDIFKFDRKQSILDYLGYLPAFSVTGSLDRNRIYYSFNNILAAVGELMLVDKEHILDEFIKLSQFREFPRWQKGISLAIRGKKNVGEEDNSLPIDINESGLGEEISGLKSFIKSFKDWKISHQKIEIPPYLLGRIMVRTYYSFLRIDADTDALQLHRQFICFFNAVAIEEYMERESAAGINLANPTGSDKIFIDNVDFIVKQAINLPLFNMIIKCPLINVYADLSILMNTTGYNTLFDENINVNIKLRKLNTIINTQEQSSSDNTFPHIVILDNVSTERVSHNFWETPDNAKKIARYAMDNNLRKVDIINNNKLTKQIVKQLFGNKKLYDKRIVNLQKILSNTNYSLKEIEWI